MATVNDPIVCTSLVICSLKTSCNLNQLQPVFNYLILFSLDACLMPCITQVIFEHTYVLLEHLGITISTYLEIVHLCNPLVTAVTECHKKRT